MELHDVVIVGAGIAGCVAAIEIATRGFDVVVLERAESVGGAKPENLQGLLPWDNETLGYITRLDRRLLLNQISSFKLLIPSGRSLSISFREPVGYVVRRGPAEDSLDSILANLAKAQGATISCKAEVASVAQCNGIVTGVRTRDGQEFSGKVFIAADGARSRLRSLLGLPAHPIKGVGFGARAKCTSLGSKSFVVAMGEQVGPGGYGYALSYPESGLVNVAICFRPEVASRRAQVYLDRMLSLLGIEESNVLSYFGGFVPCGEGTETLQVGNAIFVGEAAALQDPLLGFGIESAARSAQLAADATTSFLVTGNRARLTSYTTRVRRQLSARMSKGHVVSRGFLSKLNDRDLTTVSKWFEKRPQLITKVVFMEGDRLPWRTFIRIALERPRFLRLAPGIMRHLIAHYWRWLITSHARK